MRPRKRALLPLRPADLFSLPVLIGTSTELVLVQLASPYNLRETLVARAGLQILPALIAFALLGVVYLGLRRFLREARLRVVLLVWIPISGAAGGVALGWGFHVTGLDPPSLIPLRTFATTMHVTAVSVLLWAAVSALRLHYQRLAALADKRIQLEALNAQVGQDLAALNDEATESVRSRILEGLTGRHAESLLDRLTATIEEVVRPLSRQLESSAPAWTLVTPTTATSTRIKWGKAAIEGLSPVHFSPFGMMIVLSLMATPMNLARSGGAFHLKYLAITFAVCLPTFWLIRRLAIFVRTGNQVGAKFLVFAVMCLTSGLSLGLATLPISLSTPKPYRYVFLGPLFTFVVALIWGMAVAAQQQARATEESWRASTAELAWQTARARELHRQQRRALAHAVHGQVQAALAAGIIQLRSAMENDWLDDALIRDVEARVVACVEELNLREAQAIPLERIIAKVNATWGEIARLDLDMEPSTELQINADPQCLTTLDDVIPELVFNSIRHGKSTRIRLAMDLIDARTLLLHVDDNGSAFENPNGHGLGSRLLDDCSIDWSRKRHPGGTITILTLPLRPVAVPTHV